MIPTPAITGKLAANSASGIASVSVAKDGAAFFDRSFDPAPPGVNVDIQPAGGFLTDGLYTFTVKDSFGVATSGAFKKFTMTAAVLKSESTASYDPVKQAFQASQIVIQMTDTGDGIVSANVFKAELKGGAFVVPAGAVPLATYTGGGKTGQLKLARVDPGSYVLTMQDIAGPTVTAGFLFQGLQGLVSDKFFGARQHRGYPDLLVPRRNHDGSGIPACELDRRQHHDPDDVDRDLCSAQHDRRGPYSAAYDRSRHPERGRVAHNLPTVVNADRIYVMDQGRVLASGTHAELMRNSAAYQKLWQAYLKKQTGTPVQ